MLETLDRSAVLSVADPVAAFCASRAETRALWHRPASGDSLVALGSALSLTPEQAMVWHGPGPLLIGGFAFDPLARSTALWDGFFEGRFFVPERLISVHGGTATLTRTEPINEFGGSDQQRENRPPRLGLSPENWQALVCEVAHGIERGDLGVSKVVLARATQVRAQRSLADALAYLALNYPSCTLFAFASGDACFLGATPERLVALRDGTATTMALAGSAPRASTVHEDRAIGERLLADPKERFEHRVVVDAVREALGPLSTHVLAAAEPRLEKLSNVQHLCTPISAQVKSGHGVLDLVRRLHPTPAVGGYPREAAAALIREREELDRGWYAAPFGWLDARGDGEFVVALRSAVLRESVATLFAGCGIVGHSDPATEYAESGWKLRPMLNAFLQATP